MKNKPLVFRISVLSFVLGTLFFSACKTEYIDKVNRVLTDNLIESFALSEFSPDTVIQASIVGDAIIVYWPSYKALPETISPKIRTSESASISPASGASVPFQNGTKYTVKSESGKEKEYSLKVDLRQPIPVIEFPLSNTDISQGSLFTLPGYWYIPEKEKTKISFVDTETKREYPFGFIDFKSSANSDPQPYGITHHDVPAGDYHLKIENGIHTVFLMVKSNNERVVCTVKPKPRDEPLIISDLSNSPYTLRRGEGFSIGGSCLDHLDKVFLKKKTNDGQKFEVEYANKRSYMEWTGKIPSDMPLGEYKAIETVSSGGVVKSRTLRFNIVE